MGYRTYKPYPHGEVWYNEALRAIHGEAVSSVCGKTVEKVLKSATVSTVFGHIHRCELASETKRGAKGAFPVQAMCPGCLCRTDDAVPAATAKLNWQHGVGIGYYDPEGTMHSVYPLRIHGTAIFEGEIIEPEVSEERLSMDTGYNLIWHARN